MNSRVFKTLAVAFMTLSGSLLVSGQNSPDAMPPQEPGRPSTFRLVNEVRDAIGLDNKEFDKVFSAYEKYAESVFKDENTNLRQPPRHGSRPGGMGRPGEGNPPRGGEMGRPGGKFNDNRPPSLPAGKNPKDIKDIDVNKLEKTKAKAEEKLCKSMKKLFKKNPDKYDSWLSLRQRQLENMFPPHHPHGDHLRNRDKSN